MSENALDAHRLPGIGPMRITRLAEAGVTTLEALVSADASTLAGLPGFNAAVVSRAQAAAADLLAHPGPSGPAGAPPEVPDVPGLEPEAVAPQEPAVSEPEPASIEPVEAAGTPDEHAKSKRKHAAAEEKRSGRRKRGLDAARRIEKTLELVLRGREHTREAKSRPHKRARRQLQKLAAALEAVQQQVIRDGITTDAAAHLEELLSPLERRLRRFAKRKTSPRRLRKIRKRCRRAQEDLSRGLD
ncbi:MAG: helix-hairpin-helix domain-containing protein [Myxococcota bacterium]